MKDTRKIQSIMYLIILLLCMYYIDRGGEDAKDTMQPINENADTQIEEVKYQRDGIDASYPRIIAGGNQEELEQWNKLIEADFNKILDLYSFNPFPEAAPLPTGVVPTILTVKHDIKLMNDKFISIYYTAAYRNPFSAHPTDLVYTTNIDKEKKQKLRLSDMVQLNEAFIKDFRTWESTSYVKGNDEYNQAIKDYIANLTDEDLLMGFKAADQIGPNNLFGIYSYLTPDKLGISISAPNYIGDHIEFEREYSKLSDFLIREIE